ncbi:MAG TPA: DUF998 domain-containing protein [Methanothrix sp.]|nr:DUF998 domain-containing protein [Methanothrix sp.]HRW83302.1 DUF998 domain-containing protein [Methanothrix sp.]
MKHFNRELAGALLFSSMLIFQIGLNVAEELYPGYNVSQNYISDLGATCRGTDCHIFQPSATIFNTSIILTGVLSIIAAYLIYSEFKSNILSFLIAFSGIGAMCVGIFPEFTGKIHVIAALITFVSGGLSPIAAFFLLKSPFRYISILLGVITSVALILYITKQYLGLGPGGMERMIVYPFVLWVLGFGGYLMHPTRDDLK